MCVLQGLSLVRSIHRQPHPIEGPDKSEVNKIIQQMRDIGLKITDEGSIADSRSPYNKKRQRIS